MDEILKDGRFTKLIKDPRYRQIPKTERKVKIDKRFQSMFENEKFKVKYTVDKRGRPVNQSSSENLRKYYDLSSEESDSEDEDDETKDDKEGEVDEDANESGRFVRKPESSSDEEVEDGKKVENDQLERGDIPKSIKKKLRDLETDYARGDGVLISDSSSEEESSDEGGDDDLEHAWGELDADAATCEEATYRLAICNMDWDNIKASDLFVLLSSFLPSGGVLKSLTIYPSEFGLKRLQEEEVRGPIELTEKKIGEDSGNESENEEGSKYHMEKLRKYQLNRLKYYYAIAVFDSAATANKIYTECDGIEYESSAAKLDLRFVPDDETFDQEVHDECLEFPTSKYKPRVFTTSALQQAKVNLTWDAANPHRIETLKSAADGEVDDEDLKNYLACSSSNEESDDENNEDKESDDDKIDPITKYKNLLNEIENNENKGKNKDVEMEITWGLDLKGKTEELVKKKMNKGEKLTPFEEMIEKKKEKRKAKKLEKKKKLMEKDSNDESDVSSDDVPSDIDMNDAYFKEEFDNEEFKNKKKNNKSKKTYKDDSLDEDEERKKAELELLLDDDDGKAHFSLKKIQNAENETKSKKKRKFKKKNAVIEDTKGLTDFKVDVNDDRFSALFTSHHFNIDPTNPNFKKTKNMDVLIQEKLKRRPAEDDPEENISNKKPKKDAAMSVLINSIKRKTNNLNKK